MCVHCSHIKIQLLIANYHTNTHTLTHPHVLILVYHLPTHPHSLHSPKLTLTYPLHTLTLYLILTLTHYLILTYAHTPHLQSPSYSPSLTHPHTSFTSYSYPSRTDSCTHTHPHTLPHTHSCTHAHPHTLPHTPPHSVALILTLTYPL